MPVYYVKKAFLDGFDNVPGSWTLVQAAVVFAVCYAVKLWFSGASNGSERKMDGKVVIVTVCLGLVPHLCGMFACSDLD